MPSPAAAASKRPASDIALPSRRWTLVLRCRSGFTPRSDLADAICRAARHEIRSRGLTLADIADSMHSYPDPGTARWVRHRRARAAWAAAHRTTLRLIGHHIPELATGQSARAPEIVLDLVNRPHPD